jgi:myb proto-oncogene protein
MQLSRWFQVEGTKIQCQNRWKSFLDPKNIDRASRRTGNWTAVEDSKLKDAVRTHEDRNWGAIAALVPGRTKIQCQNRWKSFLDPSIYGASRRKGNWTAVEDSKLKDALQTHGDKNWSAIAALVRGRTKTQCCRRLKDILDPNIDGAIRSTGRWAEDEDIKLKDAIQTHGGKNWGVIAALVPGRTPSQCHGRWKDVLAPNIDGAIRSTGRWAEDEDIKLNDVVQTHDSKSWSVIAALVPGRTRPQCHQRWRYVLDPNIILASERKGKWTADEDIRLKGAMQTQGGKDWVAIFALVPGRTRAQCWSRWRDVQKPSIAVTAGRMGTWTEDEDRKLKIVALK